jgi:DNA repair protein RecN (Recombination protein N)
MVMIAELSIHNLVLADRLHLNLQAGLVALTGETGAGKSLIGQALHLACGGRAKSDLVRRGEDFARIEMVLEFEALERQRMDTDLEALGLPLSEDGRVVLRRELSQTGKSRAWVNGAAVSLRSLTQLWQHRLTRIDQGAANILKEPAGRLALLDRALAPSAPLKAMADACASWRQAQNDLNALKERLERHQDQRELMRHWVEELRKFAPDEGEWDELVALRRKARDQREQRAALNRAEKVITSDRGMLAGLAELRRIAINAKEPDALHDLTAQADLAIDAYLRHLQDQSSELLKIDEDALQERLFRWRDLARKHRCSDAELAERLRTLEDELARLEAPEDALAEANNIAVLRRDEAETLAKKLSRLRKAAAKALEPKINDLLPELGFKGAALRFDLQQVSGLSANGWDQLDLCFQANPGEGFAAVQTGASGGEKARLMLALDCSLPRRDALSAVFYDEVDAGMGGRAAQAVAKLLQAQGKQVQVIVVSHQAAVAAAADQHLMVSKNTDKGRTLLSVTTLNDDAREAELARMTSGDVAPQAAKEVARAMLGERQSDATL